MIDPKINIELFHISSNIIEVIDDREKMTNSDFQGCIEAQVMNAYYIGRNEVKNKILAELSYYDHQLKTGTIDSDELANNIIDLLENKNE